jgi:hypothetical protein
MAEPIKDPYSGNVVTPTVSIPTIDTSAVYSTPNVTQTLTTPTTKPDLSDPYGLYDYYMASSDITGAQSGVKSVTDQYNKALSTSRAQQTAIENLPQALNVIRGEQAQASSLASNTLSSLSEAKLAQQSYLDSLKTEATNKYNIALNERSQLQSLITSTKGKAGISYADSYESALQKAAKWEEDEAEEAKKEAYKDSLKSQIQALGGSTNGLSTKELEKKLKKKTKEAGASDKELKELEIALKKKELAKPYYAPKDGDNLKSSYTETEQRQMINEALAGGEDWNGIANTFEALGIDTSTDSAMDKYLKKKFGY